MDNLSYIDITQGAEKLKIPFDSSINNVNERSNPLNFTYVKCNVPGPDTDTSLFTEKFIGCQCREKSKTNHVIDHQIRLVNSELNKQQKQEGLDNGCCNDSQCSCLLPSGITNYTSEGRVVWRATVADDNGQTYERVRRECGSDCACVGSCSNRVVQHGPRYRLAVYRTARKGLGLRAMEAVPSGAFVCEYAGEVLTQAETRRRQARCNLDNNYIIHLREHVASPRAVTGIESGRCMDSPSHDVTSTDDSSSDVIRTDKSSGDVTSTDDSSSDIIRTDDSSSSYTVSSKSENNDDASGTERTSRFNLVTTVIDPSRVGNIGRFINHSCQPNLFMLPVRYEHSVPRLALFTACPVAPGEELTFDYSGRYTPDPARFCYPEVLDSVLGIGETRNTTQVEKRDIDLSFAKSVMENKNPNSKNTSGNTDKSQEPPIGSGLSNKGCFCESPNCVGFLPHCLDL